MANDEAASDGCAVPFGAMPPPTRSTRQSSRTSSPFTTSGRKSPAPAAIDPDPNQKPASMQEWTEPPRAPPQPSFMDHHFDRTSIFQDMQPLGAMPSAKLKQKMRENHARRLMASESAAVNAVDEERASTETTPAVEMARTQSQVTENTKVESVSPPQTEERKEEVKLPEKVLEPVTKPPERVQRLKITNINGPTPQISATNAPPRARIPPSPFLPPRSPSIQPPPTQPTTPSPLKSPINMASGFTHIWNKEASEAALAAANKRADEIGGKKAMITKLALMEAFRLSDHDEKLHAALAAMGAGNASNEQVRRFNNYIKRSKQRLRKELEKGETRFSMSTMGFSADNAWLSQTPNPGLPATRASEQATERARQSPTHNANALPIDPLLAAFHQSSLPASASPTAPAAVEEPMQPSTPQAVQTSAAAKSPRKSATPKQAVTPSVSKTVQAPKSPMIDADLTAPMDSPIKQASEQEQESDGELSDVNETLIRRVENENFMQDAAAETDDERSKKRRRVKDKRVIKGHISSRHRKDAARERAQEAAEEEQRLDEERTRYREHYLKEDVPKFPQKEDYTESFVRTLPTPPVHSPPLTNGHRVGTVTRSQQQAQHQPSLGDIQLNGARKRAADELDDSASSLTEDLGSTPFNSAPGTPVLPPPSKRSKTAAKTKISPAKPRGRAVAGLSRPSGGRGSGSGFANDDNDKTSDDEHLDFCVACGGEGELLCCDGCDAAYHFECCDPPLSKDSPELEEAWFCPKCRPLPRRSREASPDDGETVWGDMSKALHAEQRNFQLPKYLQNYFEDNSVGLDGEYVTGQVTYSRASHAKDGIEEHPDYFRLVDKKEKPILCCQCLQGVGFENARRPIIQCDKQNCYAYWHLDCLDPPLANPPTRAWQKGYQKTRVQWICPRHAEHDYREILNPAFSSLADQVTSASATGIFRHRMRIPRKPELVDYQRGMRTLGRVDIVNRDEDDDATLRFHEEDDLEGKVVRMPEDDVKLNFIAKVKGDRMLAEQQGLLQRPRASRLDTAFQRRSFNDQRAALNLAQFAERQNELDVNADGVAQLVYALTAQAEGELDGGDVAPSFDLDVNDRKQREQLIKVRHLIDMALANGQNPVRVSRGRANGYVPSPTTAAHLPEAVARLTPASFPRASSMQPTRTTKRLHADVADSDAFEVRSEGGFEPRVRLNGGLDERDAVSAPGSRPSSRRETRRTSNRKSAFGSK